MTTDKVSFGYREVTSSEKRRLVRDEFGAIAATYDLADTLLSFGLDALWRRKAVRLLGLEPGDRVLDACGGTAALARLAARRVAPGGRVIVCDFNRPMMAAGGAKLRTALERRLVSFVEGDVEELGFLGGSFDAVTIGFGLRNLTRPAKGLGEFLRVLRPGGRLMVLEFSLPAHALFRLLYHAYSFYWMPFAGRLICGNGTSFRYLAESIRVFPAPAETAALIRLVGFEDVSFRRLTNGIAAVYLGTKPGRPPGPSA